MQKNANNENFSLKIANYVKPDSNRDLIESVKMPPSLLNASEFRNIVKASKEEVEKNLFEDKNYSDFLVALKIKNNTLLRKKMLEIFKSVDEDLRKYIPLREMRKAKELNPYARRI